LRHYGWFLPDLRRFLHKPIPTVWRDELADQLISILKEKTGVLA